MRNISTSEFFIAILVNFWQYCDDHQAVPFTQDWKWEKISNVHEVLVIVIVHKRDKDIQITSTGQVLNLLDGPPATIIRR